MTEVFVPPSSLSHSGSSSRPMSASNRRTSTVNQHLAAALKLKLQVLERERLMQNCNTTRRISDLREELRAQEGAEIEGERPSGRRYARSWSATFYQRRASLLQNQIERKERETIELGEQKFLPIRPASAPVRGFTNVPAPVTVNHRSEPFARVRTARKCYACSPFAHRRKVCFTAPSINNNRWHEPHHNYYPRAPQAVREKWLARERYLAKHLDC